MISFGLSELCGLLLATLFLGAFWGAFLAAALFVRHTKLYEVPLKVSDEDFDARCVEFFSKLEPKWCSELSKSHPESLPFLSLLYLTGWASSIWHIRAGDTNIPWFKRRTLPFLKAP